MLTFMFWPTLVDESWLHNGRNFKIYDFWLFYAFFGFIDLARLTKVDLRFFIWGWCYHWFVSFMDLLLYWLLWRALLDDLAFLFALFFCTMFVGSFVNNDGDNVIVCWCGIKEQNIGNYGYIDTWILWKY